jgi:hypothetical protein
MLKKLANLSTSFLYAPIRKTSNTTVISTSSTTIYSVASGFNQRCSVAVVRLSGKHCLDVLQRLTVNKTKPEMSTLEPRKMYLRDIWHPVSKEKIDKCLVVWFKGSFFHSFRSLNLILSKGFCSSLFKSLTVLLERTF